MDSNDLHDITKVSMPFGKYKGRLIMDVPENYLLWLNGSGMPAGRLGVLLSLALEVKINGLEYLLEPLREAQQKP